MSEIQPKLDREQIRRDYRVHAVIQQVLDELEQAERERDGAALESDERAEKWMAAETRLGKLSEALGVIAFADTHYPSTPSGFTGDWKTLRDFAREELQKIDPEGFAKWESYE